MLSLRDSGWKCLARREGFFFSPQGLLGIFQVTAKGFTGLRTIASEKSSYDLYFLSMANMWEIIYFSDT